MKRKLLTGNGAAAWGARLARCDYVPVFPITPQTEIIENLARGTTKWPPVFCFVSARCLTNKYNVCFMVSFSNDWKIVMLSSVGIER